MGTSPPQDPRNFRGERGLCTFDARQRFVVSGTYDIPSPATNPALRAVFGGWQLGSIVTLQSGLPFSINLTSDPANTGNLNQRPNLVADPNLPGSRRTPQEWFNTSAFTLPAQYTFGNSGRDILSAPGTATVDFSLLKNIRILEHEALQFRTEFFNLLNRTNFQYPVRFCSAPSAGAICTSPAFGQILSAHDPRDSRPRTRARLGQTDSVPADGHEPGEHVFVQDCAVCCHPWQVRITVGVDGEVSVEVERE